jgi:hypothetical protein
MTTRTDNDSLIDTDNTIICQRFLCPTVLSVFRRFTLLDAVERGIVYNVVRGLLDVDEHQISERVHLTGHPRHLA